MQTFYLATKAVKHFVHNFVDFVHKKCWITSVQTKIFSFSQKLVKSTEKEQDISCCDDDDVMMITTMMMMITMITMMMMKLMMMTMLKQVMTGGTGLIPAPLTDAIPLNDLVNHPITPPIALHCLTLS